MGVTLLPQLVGQHHFSSVIQQLTLLLLLVYFTLFLSLQVDSTLVYLRKTHGDDQHRVGVGFEPAHDDTVNCLLESSCILCRHFRNLAGVDRYFTSLLYLLKLCTAYHLLDQVDWMEHNILVACDFSMLK